MRKHPKNWTHTDVLDWVFYVVEQVKKNGIFIFNVEMFYYLVHEI